MQNDLLFIQNTSTDSTEYEEKFVNLTANKVLFVDTNSLPTTTGIGLSTQFLKADGSLDSTIYEPILPETPVNPDNKYLNGNRLWSEISIGAGGYAGNVYASNVDSDISGYKTMSYALDGTESIRSIVVNNNTALSETCLYDSEVGVTVIPSGLWKATFYAKVNSTIGDTTLKIQVFTRHLVDGSETDLFEITSPTIENTADYAILRFESSQIAFTVLETDRIGIRIKGSTTRTQNTTINYIVGDGRGLYVTTPLQIRHSQLRDLNGDTNYLHVTSTEKSTWNNSVPYTGATTNVDLGLNYLNANTLKLDGVELLIDAFKSGSIGGAGTIPYSTGANSQLGWGSVNQVIGGNALIGGYLPYWDGSKLANVGMYSTTFGKFCLVAQNGISWGYDFDSYYQYGLKFKSQNPIAGSIIFSDNGDIICENLSGTGTRLVTASSTGQLGSSIISESGTSVGIGTTTPISKLSINGGLHVGGDSDAGDDNILADGTITGTQFIGSGTGLTGTASGLSIGGNASTATKLIGSPVKKYGFTYSEYNYSNIPSLDMDYYQSPGIYSFVEDMNHDTSKSLVNAPFSKVGGGWSLMVLPIGSRYYCQLFFSYDGPEIYVRSSYYTGAAVGFGPWNEK